MSDAVIVALVVAAVANIILLGKLVFTAGSVKRSIDVLIEARIPDRLLVLETDFKNLKEDVEQLREFTPPPVMAAHR
jgi:hypothetical protein